MRANASVRECVKPNPTHIQQHYTTLDSFPLTDETNDSLLGQQHNINTKNYNHQQ